MVQTGAFSGPFVRILAHGVPVYPAGIIDSFSDQRPKVSLPSHSAPQPLLEASVMTTFLLCAVSKITPCFSQRRSLQRARADTQARVTVTRWCQGDTKARVELSASARTG